MKSFIVQVAGCLDREEGRVLGEAGVDWIGLPLRLPVHHEDVSEDEAAALVATFPAAVTGVVISYEPSPVELAGLLRKLGLHTVQIHGEMPPLEIRRLRCMAPALRVIKSVVLGAPEWGDPIRRMKAYEPFVHGFITDTYDPASGARGATGKVHDWALSRELVRACPKPVILAGGLTPDNVARAVAAVRPAGVDVHTGVEGPDGRKDPALVRAFCQQARAAARDCRRSR